MTWNRSDLSRRHVRRRPGEGGSSWTKADIRRARQTRLKPVLELLGYRLLPRPGENFIIAGLASEIVIKEHYWNCLDTGQAGNAIDFLVKIRGVTFNEAMTMLTSGPMDHNGGE